MSDPLAHESYNEQISEASASDPATSEQNILFPFARQAEVEQWLREEIGIHMQQEIEHMRKDLEIYVVDYIQKQSILRPGQTSLPSEPMTVERIVVPLSPETQEKIVSLTEPSKEALEIFRAEAEEHLQSITIGVTALERSPKDQEVLQGIRRSTHTLKAAAAMMDFAQVAELAHIFEDLLDQIMGGTIQINNRVLSVILDTSEALEVLVIGQDSKHGSSATVVNVLRTRYQTLLNQTHETESSLNDSPTFTGRLAVSEISATKKLIIRNSQPEQRGNHTVEAAISGAVVDQGELSVRIKLKKLDEVVNLFGELLMNRNTLDERMYDLMHIVTGGGSRAETEAIIQECQQIFQRQTELSSAFQDQLVKMRLVPLSMMIPSLHRAAQAIALRQGKEIELIVEGEKIEVDRAIYEEITGPLLHLIRNAVTHGIEVIEMREAAGKPRVGQIKLCARYEDNQVIMTVWDDGAGINIERIRETAITRGLLDGHMSPSEQTILNLIFHPGFSTSEVITEESGRGVGLDVVSNAVRRLRGVLEVETRLGYGSTFTMKSPISLQIQLVALVRLGKQIFAIPMVHVKQIRQLDNFNPVTVHDAQKIKIDDELYMFVHLASLLSLPPGNVDTHTWVLLVAVSSNQYALLVDYVIDTQEVVSKNFRSDQPLTPGVSGITILGNGQVVHILNLLELLSHQPPSLPVLESGEVLNTSERKKQPCVLVVDDSPSVRRVVGNMLKQHGWEVQMARDGVEALEMISYETPAAVLVDIEMPRMDGYELIAMVRAQEQYLNLPLIVLSSRAAIKHQPRAFELGANAYITKPYEANKLLDIMESFAPRTTS